MRVRYTTKSGETLYHEFDESHGYTFERFFQDRMSNEGGFFPYKGGRINCNDLLRIEEVVGDDE